MAPSFILVHIYVIISLANTLPPSDSSCGDIITGAYIGEPVTMFVDLPFPGDLKFDASHSDFPVTAIEAFSVDNNDFLAMYTGDDQSILLNNMAAGQYKFVMGSDQSSSGQFIVQIACFSSNGLSELQCNDVYDGPYNGKTLVFHTTLSSKARVIFDATDSDFMIRSIEAYDEFDDEFDAEFDEDALISFIAIAGEYTFILEGDPDDSGVYSIHLRCVMIAENPSSAPTLPQTQNSNIESTQSVKPSEKQEQKSNLWIGGDVLTTYIVCGAVLIICCCSGLCVLCIIWRKGKKDEMHQEKEKDQIVFLSATGITNEVNTQTIDVTADRLNKMLPIPAQFVIGSQPKMTGNKLQYFDKKVMNKMTDDYDAFMKEDADSSSESDENLMETPGGALDDEDNDVIIINDGGDVEDDDSESDENLFVTAGGDNNDNSHSSDSNEMMFDPNNRQVTTGGFNANEQIQLYQRKGGDVEKDSDESSKGSDDLMYGKSKEVTRY